MDTLLLRDDVFLRHDPGPGHPENAARLLAVHDDLDRDPVPGTREVAPRRATRHELERIHSSAHVDGLVATEGRPRTVLDADTAASADSWEAARRAAGAVLQGTESVVQGRARGALALVRPPGHHAEATNPMGFCLVNNVAVAAAHATEELECRRVLVLDPDVHHGNGTQHSFAESDRVLYASSHRFPFYPGTGAHDEVGHGAGAGFTINLPLPPGMGDADFVHVWSAVVEPVALAWKPDLVLVSAGFDTWHRDPLGGMGVTAAGFAALFALFARWADACCPGRLVSALEGGYDPAGVVAGVRAALAAKTGSAPDPESIATPPSAEARAVARRARATLAPFWPVLRD